MELAEKDEKTGDYFQSRKDWIKIRPQITELLEKSKKRANKEISHLTYTRIDITPEDKKWHFIEISKDIYNVFDFFIQNIDKELLSSEWNDFKIIRQKYNNV